MQTNPFHIGVVTLSGSPQKLGDVFSAYTGPNSVKTLILSLFASVVTDFAYVGDLTLNSTTKAGVIIPISHGGYGTFGGMKTADNIDWREFYVLGTSGDLLVVAGQREG